jgi:5-carboxymethyl-2-hydroxymuconate isomerase
MLLRYIEDATLLRTTKTKQDNGTYTETTETLKTYKVQTQELTDEVSFSIYGANIFKMLRIRSVDGKLEEYLYARANNKVDNISMYIVEIGQYQYKVKAVNQKGVDLELV